MTATPSGDAPKGPQYSAAEIGALAHLYRGEMYRSKIWRNRLDATTNWAVVSMGIALSVVFSGNDVSPLPLILVGMLVLVFLILEARRYRYFDIWRVRVRIMETSFFSPMLLGKGVRTDNRWNEILVEDYRELHFHISFLEAFGRRLRRNYSWIFAIEFIAYLGKLFIHPFPLQSVDHLWVRATIGIIPGEVVVGAGVLYHLGLFAIGFLTLRNQKAVGRAYRPRRRDDPIREFAGEL